MLNKKNQHTICESMMRDFTCFISSPANALGILISTSCTKYSWVVFYQINHLGSLNLHRVNQKINLIGNSPEIVFTTCIDVRPILEATFVH